MSFTAGLDVGASATKAAVLDKNGDLAGKAVLRSGTNFTLSAQKALDTALQEAGISQGQLERVFSCGYGRGNVEFADQTRTEIACHAAGAYHHFPRAITVVDIGGQDNKIIKLDENGGRTSFKMNRKCAAGTGAFLEEMALRLDIDLSELSGLAQKAQSETSMGSYCTVFTGTEILARIREGVAVDSLVKGLFRSVIKRVREMDTMGEVVVMTGGVVAHNPFLVEMMSEELGREVLTPPWPQLTGAEGAAILARRDLEKGKA